MSPSRNRLRFLLPLGIGLLVGGGVLPALIYGVGITILGRYEGASLGRIYQVVLGGLAKGSVAAWIVFLGPYALYLLARLARSWWQASARHA
jgi:hypothetical protein